MADNRTSAAVLLLLLFASLSLIGLSDAVVKRCFSCRSRGDLGSCKDRFKYTNLTHLASEPGVGVEAVPCASGWCGKIIETRNSEAKEQEFDTATQRTCLQRGPSDNEERCSDTTWEYKKVFMCFCHGDLCNGAPPSSSSDLMMMMMMIGLLVAFVQF